MMRRFLVALLIMCLVVLVAGPMSLAQSLPFGGTDTGTVLDSDPFLGDWLGTWIDVPDKVKILRDNLQLAAQVIPRGGQRYEIRFLPELDRRCCPYQVVEGTREGDCVTFDNGSWSGVLTACELTGQGDLKGASGKFRLIRADRSSPTLGSRPPEGAVVLFDGEDAHAWRRSGREEGPILWRIGGGSLEIAGTSRNERHSLETREAFEDMYLHLEFRLPLEPENTGQARGNSGLYIGPYEIQILDSYGLPGYYNECGALYKLAAPRVNMCFAPLVWQTYDVIYRAARFDDEGRLEEEPRITVKHNGVLIHDDVKLVHYTANSQVMRYQPVPQGPVTIKLQNHGHPVRFRNIWVLPVDNADPTADPADAGFRTLFPDDGEPEGWLVRRWDDVGQPADEAAQWIVRRGILHGSTPRGTWLVSEDEYADFELKYEFLLGPRGNSGCALRAPLQGDPAFDGMELQMADLRYNTDAKESELTGGIYRALAPRRQVYRPEQWNECHIILVGSHLRAFINGALIHDVDLAQQQQSVARHDGSAAPPLSRRPRRGHLGFQELSRGGDHVRIRNARIKTIRVDPRRNISMR